jgi:hypothetical protein
MPTDAPAGESGDPGRIDSPAGAPDDLTFAAHDFGRDPAPRQAAADDELGFASTARPAAESPAEHTDSFVATERAGPPAPVRLDDAPAPPPLPFAVPDGFVIREPGAAPTAPVDALVVGAPLRAGDTPTPKPTPLGSFTITTMSLAAADPNAPPPWTVRAPESPPEASAIDARRGWGTRAGSLTDGSAHAAMIRLREEAVQVSWKAAWIAVTAADPRLLRKRNR